MFIFIFVIFLFPKFQISFDYDEVLAKIYKMQKKKNRLKTDEVIDKIARAINLKWTGFSFRFPYDIFDVQDFTPAAKMQIKLQIEKHYVGE